MRPRWKRKTAEAEALANPMSLIVSKLSASLAESNAQALLTGSSARLDVEAQQTEVIELLLRSCLGEQISTADKDKKWFKFDMEEAFYLSYDLKCLKVIGNDSGVKSDVELWQYMNSKNPNFPVSYKGYSHLRRKNWVVRPDTLFGMDFMDYRHHPSLIHSEYAVIVSSVGGDGDANGRLRLWSDVRCTLRIGGGVAKTLLVLDVGNNGDKGVSILLRELFCCRNHNQKMESRTQPRGPDNSRTSNQVKVRCFGVCNRDILSHSCRLT